MIGQINNVLCYFGKLPSQVKSRLLYAYCSSLYGCELWDLWNSNIASVCVAWRKALRRVWNLPLNTHSYFLFELSHALPVYDAVCKRVLSFSSKCVNSDGGTAAAAPPPFRPSDPALFGSRPLVTPYYCRLGDLLCYSVYNVLCVHYCLCISVFSCFRCFLCLL